MRKASFLSLSLLTVMAGAAVAPALSVIRAYFSDASALMIQLIISIPAVFIFLTSFIFPKLTALFRVKALVLIGLTFYVLGGCLAGLFSNIYMVLIFRALVGIGVGIIMPLSTGLLSAGGQAFWYIFWDWSALFCAFALCQTISFPLAFQKNRAMSHRAKATEVKVLARRQMKSENGIHLSDIIRILFQCSS